MLNCDNQFVGRDDDMDVSRDNSNSDVVFCCRRIVGQVAGIFGISAITIASVPALDRYCMPLATIGLLLGSAGAIAAWRKGGIGKSVSAALLSGLAFLISITASQSRATAPNRGQNALETRHPRALIAEKP